MSQSQGDVQVPKEQPEEQASKTQPPESRHSTATSTPVMNPITSVSPEASARAHCSHYFDMHIKELKERLLQLGTTEKDLEAQGITEKEELVNLLIKCEEIKGTIEPPPVEI